jgi:hypothetical protein
MLKWGRGELAIDDWEKGFNAKTQSSEDAEFFNHSGLLPLERDSPRQGWTQLGKVKRES